MDRRSQCGVVGVFTAKVLRSSFVLEAVIWHPDVVRIVANSLCLLIPFLPELIRILYMFAWLPGPVCVFVSLLCL